MARRNRPAADRDTRAPDAHTPSSPTRPPVICLYCYRRDKRIIISWATLEGAAAFLEYLVQDFATPDKFKWVKSDATRRTGLLWENEGVRVEADTEAGLERLIETETTWELPEPYTSQIAQFMSDHVVEPDDRSTEARAAKKQRRARGEPKPDKPPTKASSRPADFVHVSELVPDVAPPHARAALRTLGWPKPDYGWWFALSDKDRVTKAIKGALK